MLLFRLVSYPVGHHRASPLRRRVYSIHVTLHCTPCLSLFRTWLAPPLHPDITHREFQRCAYFNFHWIEFLSQGRSERRNNNNDDVDVALSTNGWTRQVASDRLLVIARFRRFGPMASSYPYLGRQRPVSANLYTFDDAHRVNLFAVARCASCFAGWTRASLTYVSLTMINLMQW